DANFSDLGKETLCVRVVRNLESEGFSPNVDSEKAAFLSWDSVSQPDAQRTIGLRAFPALVKS
ncbi:hypothetical protein CpipJ_CPIJ008555, partial [Culex quinquefasciatus]